MASLHFVQSHGIAFTAKVRDLLNSQVTPSSTRAPGFSMLAAFSRNTFRLDSSSVASCLQNVLGAAASGFRVSQISQQVFKFVIASKHVGFLCEDLRDFTCDAFNLGFFFSNASGLSKASLFSRKLSGPAYHWELPRPRHGKAVSHIKSSLLDHPLSFKVSNFQEKSKKSYGIYSSRSGYHSDKPRSFTDVVRTSSGSPQRLTGANTVPIGQNLAFTNNHQFVGILGSSSSSPQSRRSVFDRISFKSASQQTGSLASKNLISSGPSLEKINDQNKRMSRSFLCSRCLSSSHKRSAYRNRISCWHCRRAGHTLNDCKPFHSLQAFIMRCGSTFGCVFSPGIKTSDWPLDCYSTWFKAGPPDGSNTGTSGPRIFSNLEDLALSLHGRVTRSATSNPTVGLPASSSPPFFPLLQQYFPPDKNSPHCRSPKINQAQTIAFLNIDPQPLMLAGFHRVMVQGRQQFTRVVVPRALPRNEDLAIVTLGNLPPGEIPFGPLRNAVFNFLVHDLGLEVREVQRCPFGRGEAFVRMGRPSDRDALIARSPLFHNGLSFTFVQHNRAPNARRVNFNRECWLMLIGFPIDSRSSHEIEDSIRSFGRMILWQKDDVLTRVILKARVTDLVDIPHYLILSEGDDFEGVSYTVQCEILQQNMLGAQLQDEDIPPGGPDGEFIFPGFQLNDQLQQDQPHQHNMDLDGQGGQLPDLNGNPAQDNIANEQEEEEEGMNEEDFLDMLIEEAQALHEEEEEPQVILDLDLNLSPPPRSSSSSELDNDPLPIIVYTEGIPQAIAFNQEDQHPEQVPVPPMGQHMDIHAQQAALQDGPLIHPKIVLGLPANNQEAQIVAANQIPNDQPMGHINVNLALLLDIQWHRDPMFAQKSNKYVVLPETLFSPSESNPKTSGAPQNPNIFRLWAQHFSPAGCPEQVTYIPSDWASFFINMLLSPQHFDWAKKFLASAAWNFMLNCADNPSMMAFSIPPVCPRTSPLPCISQEEEGGISSTSSAEKVTKTPTLKKARARLGSTVAPECESSVRRSSRIKARNEGFRAATCQDSCCLACHSKAPTLSSAHIQGLGEKVCSIDSSKISSASLSAKTNSMKAIGIKGNSSSQETPKKTMKTKPQGPNSGS
uniref:CCHC-type domain-containing protein n=1 Tax=Setaria viridis TaxID=4556 RepID=A0A4U6V5C8_SETVI|nr:hypothetical protein SEVIR_4G243200v2 [Setaria viridis]